MSKIPVAPSLDDLLNEGQQPGQERPVSRRVLFLSIQAVLNAVIIGFIAKLLVALISLITNLAFYGEFSFHETSPAHNALGIWVLAIPIVGGLIVGLMARLGSPAIRGHGIPEAMEQVLTNESRIKPIITLLKPLSAAISIGTGGPFGAEGPIISTGGAFGSFAGQIMRISPNERKVMLTAGATAGMSAIFGTPVAAVLLAIELLLFEFSPRSIIPVALACATGAAMHLLLFGTAPVFTMPEIQAPTYGALIWYTGMGAVIGVASALISKSIYLIEDLFEHLPVHWMWWPAIGAVAIGVTGYFAPYTLGVGYNNITDLLTGSVSLQLVLGLCFLKFISWAVSLGSGTSGGDARAAAHDRRRGRIGFGHAGHTFFPAKRHQPAYLCVDRHGGHVCGRGKGIAHRYRICAGNHYAGSRAAASAGRLHGFIFRVVLYDERLYHDGEDPPPRHQHAAGLRAGHPAAPARGGWHGV
jgi:H+/Cl- antiporter ClcA